MSHLGSNKSHPGSKMSHPGSNKSHPGSKMSHLGSGKCHPALFRLPIIIMSLPLANVIVTQRCEASHNLA